MAKVVLTDEQIEALREEHGEVAVADTVLGTAVFRPPTPEEYRKAMKMRLHPTQGPYAGPWIAGECVVSPDKATWKAWASARPGIPRSVAVDNAIHRLVGLDRDAVAVDSDDGDTVTVTTCMGDATFKVPDDRQLREFDKRTEGDDKLAAFDFLALACVTSPDRPTFAKWLESKPAIAATVTPHIRRIAGLDADERLKG